MKAASMLSLSFALVSIHSMLCDLQNYYTYSAVTCLRSPKSDLFPTNITSVSIGQ